MEGPPVRVIAEKLAFCSGQTIVSVHGNTKLDISGMEGQHVMRVYSRGKNLVLALSRYCVKIHFLMFGSYRINEERPGMTPRLSLVFDTGTINFYACSVRILTSTEIDDLYPEHHDITSPEWDIEGALARCHEHRGDLVCDCLLDQEVFLGVGNIIKNEALFLARIHPLTVMEAIPVPHLKDLALKAREFSMIFYRCVRQDARLGSYLTIYRKAVCPACAGTVLLKKMGMTKRMTSCCPSCQTLFV